MASMNASSTTRSVCAEPTFKIWSWAELKTSKGSSSSDWARCIRVAAVRSR
ncbi:Uncharacterised protein [Mycobacteroides abscessus subsp. abscessus]|nr:Uncharacterised protein [Mycobacteroides abscessus subsp. abscessus]